jgi:three-Cys-motif partner protein
MDDIDPEDGLPVGEVGEWALDKHSLLRKYIDITKATRRKFTDVSRPAKLCGGATYIEVFAGSGRARIKETGALIDGSPLVAFKSATTGGVPFSEIHLGDIREDYSTAASKRIKMLGGSAQSYTGKAEETAKEIVKRLNPYGLHLAFLDPFNLANLSFALIQTFASVKRVDLLMHISAQDIQRNADRYTAEDCAIFDTFAPGWRTEVDLNQNLSAIRIAVLNYWQKLLRHLGFLDSRWELIRGSRSQRLYWLALASREKIANYFWDEIRNTSGQGELGF